MNINLCECGCGGCAKNNKRFIAGHNLRLIPPHNRGKTGPRGKNSPSWKGGKTNNFAGQPCVLNRTHPRAYPNGYVQEHILKAETAMGKPIELPHVIHHHTDEQLVICENQAYHLFIHQRTRALRACGHANWIKCSYCKKYDDPINLRNRKHPDCQKKYMSEYNQRRKSHV